MRCRLTVLRETFREMAIDSVFVAGFQSLLLLHNP
jgi:hypothetical protein